MTHSTAFDYLADDYHRWFDEHPLMYLAEISAVHQLLPGGVGAEIGMGTGRFAQPLGISFGVDPARAMLAVARHGSTAACQAVGQALPFACGAFDFTVLITVVCFVEHPWELFQEASRILRPGGRVIIGLIDRDSSLGQRYESSKAANPLYRDAHFHSIPGIIEQLAQVGFAAFDFRQTLIDPAHGADPHAVLSGYGGGAFVCISAKKLIIKE